MATFGTLEYKRNQKVSFTVISLITTQFKEENVQKTGLDLVK